MSRLTELIAQTRAKDPQLGDDLEREFRALASRRGFGLNFERHRPESVELPSRPVRKGDKVRLLPERGSGSRGDKRLWAVKRIVNHEGVRVAEVEEIGIVDPEVRNVAVDDSVVVSEFRDLVFPGLVSTGKVEQGGNKPYHAVINGENYHVLKALSYSYRGRIDAIYIDPPYNSGATDWKYNNDYVDADDLYRHSKWLAFMERRLLIAKELLKPDRGVIIVTIDEREYLRLGLLLEQTFPEATIQMVTSVISAKGVVRRGRFSRVEEHIFFVTFGDAAVRNWSCNMLPSYLKDDGETPDEEIPQIEVEPTPIEWLGLRRREPSSVRGSRPNQFFPIYVHATDGKLHSIGDPIEDDVDRHSVPVPEGTVALWPLKPDGTEMLWGLTPEVLRRNWAEGYARVNWRPTRQNGTVYYLPSGTIGKIRSGAITTNGRAEDGSVQGYYASDATIQTPPKRVWNMKSHNAETGGTNLLSALIPNRPFPYPKSLYAVEDTLRFFVGDNREAIVLDFFAGSGTTAHAVMRLNRQDGGQRQCILLTNNEVSAEEQERLRNPDTSREQPYSLGLRPGDPQWEALGICDFITKPRVEAAITGKTPQGVPIAGDYKFNDAFPIADGFDENAEFFTLTYETPISISHNLAFARIAPLLWLRAGSVGRRIDAVPECGWDITDTYGVIFNLDKSAGFSAAVEECPTVRYAFIVTDDDRRFQALAQHLPSSVETVRLYESYLANFRFANGE